MGVWGRDVDVHRGDSEQGEKDQRRRPWWWPMSGTIPHCEIVAHWELCMGFLRNELTDREQRKQWNIEKKRKGEGEGEMKGLVEMLSLHNTPLGDCYKWRAFHGCLKDELISTVGTAKEENNINVEKCERQRKGGKGRNKVKVKLGLTESLLWVLKGWWWVQCQAERQYIEWRWAVRQRRAFLPNRCLIS